MKVIQNKNFIEIRIAKGYTFPDVISRLENLLLQHADANVVVDLKNYENWTEADVQAFIALSENHKKNKKSFVLINHNVDFNSLPDALTVVPTKTEAGDFIEMEEIERDLGF